jgi:hypothetical protein
MCPTDAKVLYRRALAREQLDKVGSAFTDAKEALRLAPGDKYGHFQIFLNYLILKFCLIDFEMLKFLKSF